MDNQNTFCGFGYTLTHEDLRKYCTSIQLKSNARKALKSLAVQFSLGIITRSRLTSHSHLRCIDGLRHGRGLD